MRLSCIFSIFLLFLFQSVVAVDVPPDDTVPPAHVPPVVTVPLAHVPPAHVPPVATVTSVGVVPFDVMILRSKKGEELSGDSEEEEEEEREGFCGDAEIEVVQRDLKEAYSLCQTIDHELSLVEDMGGVGSDWVRICLGKNRDPKIIEEPSGVPLEEYRAEIRKARTRFQKLATNVFKQPVTTIDKIPTEATKPTIIFQCSSDLASGGPYAYAERKPSNPNLMHVELARNAFMENADTVTDRELEQRVTSFQQAKPFHEEAKLYPPIPESVKWSAVLAGLTYFLEEKLALKDIMFDVEADKLPVSNKWGPRKNLAYVHLYLAMYAYIGALGPRDPRDPAGLSVLGLPGQRPSLSSFRFGSPPPTKPSSSIKKKQSLPNFRLPSIPRFRKGSEQVPSDQPGFKRPQVGDQIPNIRTFQFENSPTMDAKYINTAPINPNRNPPELNPNHNQPEIPKKKSSLSRLGFGSSTSLGSSAPGSSSSTGFRGPIKRPSLPNFLPIPPLFRKTSGQSVTGPHPPVGESQSPPGHPGQSNTEHSPIQRKKSSPVISRIGSDVLSSPASPGSSAPGSPGSGSFVSSPASSPRSPIKMPSISSLRFNSLTSLLGKPPGQLGTEPHSLEVQRPTRGRSASVSNIEEEKVAGPSRARIVQKNPPRLPEDPIHNAHKSNERGPESSDSESEGERLMFTPPAGLRRRPSGRPSTAEGSSAFGSERRPSGKAERPSTSGGSRPPRIPTMSPEQLGSFKGPLLKAIQGARFSQLPVHPESHEHEPASPHNPHVPTHPGSHTGEPNDKQLPPTPIEESPSRPPSPPPRPTRSPVRHNSKGETSSPGAPHLSRRTMPERLNARSVPAKTILPRAHGQEIAGRAIVGRKPVRRKFPRNWVG